MLPPLVELEFLEPAMGPPAPLFVPTVDTSFARPELPEAFKGGLEAFGLAGSSTTLRLEQ